MKRSKFSEEQITYALRQADGGTPVSDVCRQLGVSEATFYVWKKKYAHLGVTELRQLRQLEEENQRLKRVVADLSLDKHILCVRSTASTSPPFDTMCRNDVLPFTVISVGAGGPSSYPSNSFFAESSGMCSNVTTGVLGETCARSRASHASCTLSTWP